MLTWSAFAFFDPTTFKVSSMDANSASLYKRTTALKAKYRCVEDPPVTSLFH